MQLHSNSTPLAWLEFPLLSQQPNLIHASYTRLFGASVGPYASLNIGRRIEDSPESIQANITKIITHFWERNILKIERPHYAEMNQVHGKECLMIRSIRELEHLKNIPCDAFATNVKNIILTVKHADCQPILLYEPKKKVIAAIHAGWRGLTQNIISHVIERLQEEWGVNPIELLAGIGPSIGPEDYEFQNWQTILPSFMHRYINPVSHTLDLWQASIEELVSCGLLKNNISAAFVSTYTLTSLFFSARKEKTTGRNATSIMLS